MSFGISWYTIPTWLICLIGQYVYVSMIEFAAPSRFSFRFHKLAYAAASATLLSTISLALPAHFRLLFNILLYLCIAIFLYRGKITKKLLIFALWVALYPIAEAITVYVAPSFGWRLDAATQSAHLIFDLCCTSVLVIFYFLFRNTMRIIEDRLDRRLWGHLALTALTLIGSTITILFSNFTRDGYLPATWIANNIGLISSIGMFLPTIALLGLFSMIHKLNGSIRESEEAHFMEAQARSELHRNQAMIAKDQQYRQLRHDIKNHLLVIDALGQKGELDRQHEYLSSLNAAFAQTEEAQFCGHPLIDILLEAKSVRMQKAGIEVKWNLCPVENDLHISDMDLCSLIGNVIDNAIEACERNAAEIKPWMSISLQSDGSGLVFQVVNACPNPEAVIAEMEKRSWKRREGAGVGLKAVRRIADSYNGELLIRPGADKASMEVSAYLPGK